MKLWAQLNANNSENEIRDDKGNDLRVTFHTEMITKYKIL